VGGPSPHSEGDCHQFQLERRFVWAVADSLINHPAPNTLVNCMRMGKGDEAWPAEGATYLELTTPGQDLRVRDPNCREVADYYLYYGCVGLNGF